MTNLFPNLFPEAQNRAICSEQEKHPLTCTDAQNDVFAGNRSGTGFGCRNLFRTGRNSWPFALVRLFRTGQNRFCPGSTVPVPLSLSIGEGTGPSPRVPIPAMSLCALSIEIPGG